MRGAGEACQRQGVAFLPIVVGSCMDHLIKACALFILAGQEEEAVRHLWGKLGMLLQRGNAAILANRVPSFPPAAIDGMH